MTASVEWLDDRTVGVRGTSLHLVRDGEEVLSLRVAQIAGEIWVERNGRDLARLRHDEAAMFPMLP